MLRKQPVPSIHLVSDLDGTWLPLAEGLPGLRSLEDHLTRVTATVLTFATGRSLHSAVSELSHCVRLWPDHFVTDVGTAIYHRAPQGKWVEDQEYARMVHALWDTEAAERLSQSLPHGVRRQPGLEPRRRLALETYPGHSLERAAEDLAELLAQAWFSADVLPSAGRFLDVLPRGVNKGTAITYLRDQLQSPMLLVVCGDSENDLDMFRVADLGVLMANSPLKEAAIGLPESRLIRPKAPGPAGILEVMTALKPEPQPGALPSPAGRTHAGQESGGGAQ